VTTLLMTYLDKSTTLLLIITVGLLGFSLPGKIYFGADTISSLSSSSTFPAVFADRLDTLGLLTTDAVGVIYLAAYCYYSVISPYFASATEEEG